MKGIFMKTIVVVLGASLLLAAPTFAKKVTACSKQNFEKCVTGQTKQAKHGKKVRLPGGTWVYCAGDCKNTLRRYTVDFWYEQKINN